MAHKREQKKKKVIRIVPKWKALCVVGYATVCDIGIPYGWPIPVPVVPVHVQVSADGLLKAVKKGPSPWTPASIWEAWKKLLETCFTVPNPWPLGHLAREVAGGRSLSLLLSLSFSHALSLSVCFANKVKLKKIMVPK